MSLWWQVPLVLSAVALSVALVAAILALRQTLQRAERLFATIERELGPTLEGVRGLTQEAQAATRETRNGVMRVSAIVEHVGHVTASVGALVIGLGGLTRAGQIVGVAAGIRKGIDVFIQRWATPKGGKHGS
jgi:Bacterial protein of unknown function (DUF948)